MKFPGNFMKTVRTSKRYRERSSVLFGHVCERDDETDREREREREGLRNWLGLGARKCLLYVVSNLSQLAWWKYKYT